MDLVKNPLQYSKHVRFPGDLERGYREEYSGRALVTQRLFIVFGFVVYSLFAILDYYAMPQSYHIAWLLRLLVAPFAHAFHVVESDR